MPLVVLVHLHQFSIAKEIILVRMAHCNTRIVHFKRKLLTIDTNFLRVLLVRTLYRIVACIDIRKYFMSNYI